MTAARGGGAHWAMLPVLVLGLGGCGEEHAPPAEVADATQTTVAVPVGENEAPVVERVSLEPREPRAGDVILAKVTATDTDGDRLRMLFSWSVNGEVQEVGRSPSFRPKTLRSGDRVAVEVVASDGRLESQPFQASTSAGNRGPVIRSVRLAPDPAKPGQTLEALVDADDPDDDRLRFEHTWYVNGDRQGRGDANFETDSLRRGDKVQVSVAARDGSERSPSERSQVIELANSPPVFSGVPRREQVDGVFFYRLEARDPDGDRSLRYRLAQGPPGMSIDPLSGVLRWQPAPEHAGTHAVEVTVRDRFGGESVLGWSVDVSVTQQELPAAPAR